MNSFWRLLSFILLLALVGCVTQTQNSLQGQALRNCKSISIQHYEFCRKNCVNNCPACSAASSRSAAAHFKTFVVEREVEGKMITRELNSYRDPLQCRKVTCSCIADFMTCDQGCSGIIRKKLQAVPYCI